MGKLEFKPKRGEAGRWSATRPRPAAKMAAGGYSPGAASPATRAMNNG